MSAAKKARTEAPAARPLAAVAFDIDGVFKYGRQWSKDGLLALQRVSAAGLPFVFVTNGGGGLTETAYAAQLADKVASAATAAPDADDGSASAKASPAAVKAKIDKERLILSCVTVVIDGVIRHLHRTRARRAWGA